MVDSTSTLASFVQPARCTGAVRGQEPHFAKFVAEGPALVHTPPPQICRFFGIDYRRTIGVIQIVLAKKGLATRYECPLPVRLASAPVLFPPQGDPADVDCSSISTLPRISTCCFQDIALTPRRCDAVTSVGRRQDSSSQGDDAKISRCEQHNG